MSGAAGRRRLAGRYHLLEPLGQGGMGIVWRAHDELLDRTVAVKEVVHRALDEAERRRFNQRTIREARAAGRLDHPNVIVVHDVVEEDGRPWIVMQFVRSRSLGDVVRAEGPLPPRRVAEIGLAVLDALRAAHAAGVLHRDVKPENVLLTEEGRVVLTDFGIATISEEASLTASGLVSGTPAFLPPERLHGLPALPESDLWSLGATLYAAVEGRPPFDRDAPAPTMVAVLQQPPDPMRRAGPLAPLLEAMLRKDPAGRPAPEAVAAELARIAATPVTLPQPGPPGEVRRAGGDRPPAFPPESPALTAFAAPYAKDGRPSRRGRRLVLLAGLPVLLVAAGVGGWLGLRESSAGGPGSSSAAAVPGETAAPASAESGTPSAGSGPAVSSPTPRSRPPASPTPWEPPRGWREHTDSAGFSLALPPGWRNHMRQAQDTRIYFRGPQADTYLLVDLTPAEDPDPVRAWEKVSAMAVAEGKLTGYRLIGITPVRYRGRPAADWEFTWITSGGTRMHVRDRGFRSADGRSFAIYWQTPEAGWEEGLPLLTTILRSFRPR